MSPRTEEQNAQIKNMRREQILSAALKVFARRGYFNTKIGDIAERSGVSHGLVYHYFESKEEIFSELLHRAIMGSTQSFQAAEKIDASPIGKLTWFIETILESLTAFEDSAYYFMIVIHAAIMESSEEDRAFAESAAASVGSLVNIISDGQKAGEIREGDPLSMAMTLSAAIQGLSIFKLSVCDFVMPDADILINMLK